MSSNYNVLNSQFIQDTAHAVYVYDMPYVMVSMDIQEIFTYIRQYGYGYQSMFPRLAQAYRIIS